ncbi:MAG: hypothetical protein JSS55_03930 [Proteobacteria bacterium]|nr:hypothetical protein [Pseudomonadota bacterium]
MITKRDDFTIRFTSKEIWDDIERFSRTPLGQIHSVFNLPPDSDWTVANAQSDVLETGPDRSLIKQVLRAPFDKRFTYYTGKTRGFHARPVFQTMRHMNGVNFGLSVIRKMDVSQPWQHSFCSDGLMIHHAVSMKEGNYLSPLYLYPEDNTLDQAVRLNVDPKLYAAICAAGGIDPADTDIARKSEKAGELSSVIASEAKQSSSAVPGSPRAFGPRNDDAAFRRATGDARPSEVKVFDYIYGVLHAPAYRETFAEFLKIDFPRIPYPASPEVFRHVSEKGERLRRLHLMEPAAIGETPYPYQGDGDDVVASGYPKLESDGVHINKSQYFANVPALAWTFHIGGYQPAQKWLKDRRGRTLSWDDIGHYQTIIKILVETDCIMKEIDLPLFMEAG